MSRCLRRRITLTTAAVAGAGLLLAGWVTPQLTERALVAQLRHDAHREAELVLSLIDPSGPIQVPPTSDGRLVQVRDADGGIVAASNAAVSLSHGGDEIQVLAGVAAAEPGWVTAAGFNPSSLDGGWYVAEAARQTPAGNLHAYVATPLAGVRPAVEAVRAVMAVLVPVLLIGIAALTWWSVSRTLRPVERVRRQAAAAVRTGAPVTFDVPDTDIELARLVETFNTVIAQLHTSLERQRRLVADASHELLTPLASIQTQLEVALRRSDPDWRSVAQRCLAIEGRLSEVSQNLLMLASHDASRARRTTRFDLARVVREEAITHTIPIAVEAPEPVEMDGDRAAVAQLVHNLVANAVRHAHAAVTITVQGHRDLAALTVDDDGPGVPERERQRIFEPFVRLEADRGRRSGGAGLGLAIAAAVAADHDGSVEADDSPSGGARFVVRLPRTGTIDPAAAGRLAPRRATS